jgi:hypothetical protein
MKKILVFALSLSLGFSAANAQTVPAPAANQKIVTDGPVISFAESKFDFGTIKEGEIVKHTYNFKNTGNQPLLISDVRVTCGCTTPDWTKTPVAPGQSGFITAQFNSTGKVGQNNKVITVVSNSVTGNTPISFITNVTARDAQSTSSVVAPQAAPVAAAASANGSAHAAEAAKKTNKKVKK